MRNLAFAMLTTVSAVALTTPTVAFAQEEPIETSEDDFVTDDPLVEESDATGTIIVTARRREESIQEVPIVINTVSAEDIAQLNLREFEEVEGLVPGLSLSSQGFAGGGAIRGIAFDSRASGNNASVEFYVNDTPINGGVVLQQMYDISQIEILRGPQGTLRGRASPSGAITVTTRKPDLDQFGGNVSMTGTETGTLNLNGAIGVPIIPGVAAIRVAGLHTTGDGNEVRTVATSSFLDRRDPRNRSTSARVSAVIEPVHWLRLEGAYQYLDTFSRNLALVESASIAHPTAAASPIPLTASDRRSIESSPTLQTQRYDTFTWRAELAALGQNLIYVGNYRESKIVVDNNDDNANLFPGRDFGQLTDSDGNDEAHEIRLQNEDRLFDMFDYVVGAFYQNNNPSTNLVSETAVRLPGFLGGRLVTVAETPVERIGGSEEISVFGNVTAYFGEDLEISGGLRYLKIESESQLFVAGNLLIDNPEESDKLIYTASANYFINPDVMIYGSTGTSFRPGPTAIGDFSARRSQRQRDFTTLPPEESTNYEIGLKSTLMDGRLRFNVSGYYQDFKNYPYRSPGNGVFYQSFGVQRDASRNVIGLVPEVSNFNFVAAVPVKVKGVEAEIGFEISRNWDISLVASYVDGQIQDGVIPCNDLNGDGIPDNLTARPTLAEVQAAYGDDYLGACTVSQRSGFQAPFTATVQSEYDFAISPRVDVFARGLFSFFGDSRNNPQNVIDDVDSYGLLNLYTGIRDPGGRWEVSLYGKNILDTVKVLERDDVLVSTSFRELQPPTFRTAASGFATAPYRAISTTPVQEFGLNVRFAFGSR